MAFTDTTGIQTYGYDPSTDITKDNVDQVMRDREAYRQAQLGSAYVPPGGSAAPTPAPSFEAPASGGAVIGGSSNGGSSTTTTTGTTTSGKPSFNLANLQTQGPTNWNVGGNQTVADQLAQVLAKDSPLMQQARTRALQRAQANGQQNSAMALSAGEAAMYDAAMPIATADAAMYGNAAQFNAGAANTFTRDSNQFNRDVAMADFNLGANDWAAQRQLERDMQRDQTAIARDATAEQATLKRGYINALNQARSDYAEKLAGVSSSSSMSSELKAETMANLKASYNTVIKNYANLLGWDANSWLIGTDDGSGGGGGGTGSGGGATLPPSVGGDPINWNQTGHSATEPGKTLSQLYDDYKASGGAMSASDWYLSRFRQSGEIAGPGNSDGPGDADGPGGSGTGW